MKQSGDHKRGVSCCLRITVYASLFLMVGFLSLPAAAQQTATRLVWQYFYDSDGRITEIQSPSGLIHYEYSRITGRKTAIWTGTDLATQHNRMEYGYDALGRLQEVRAVRCNGAALDPAYVTRYSYNPVGSVETVNYPNGFHSVYDYDALNRLNVLTHYLSSQPEAMMLAQYEYSYNADGTRARAVETLWNSGTLDYDSREVTWTYDSLNRVTEENLSGGYTLQFQYDLVGNCLRRTLDGAATHFFYNSNDELLKESPNADGSNPSIEYEYDDNGSMARKIDHVTGKETVYEYNLQNRLKAVFEDSQSVASYLYHPEGYRLGKEAGGTMVWYLSDPYNPTGYVQVLEEVSDSSTTTYFHGLHVLGQKTNSADPMFFLPDGHGSTRQTVQAPVTTTPPPTAPTMQQIHYNAYGKLIPGATAPATNVLYTNQRYDPDLNMYDLRRREYDPGNMRFTQHDPFAGSINDPMSLHRYLYCNANPINRWDPSGEMSGFQQTMTTLTVVSVLGSLYYPALQHHREDVRERLNAFEKNRAIVYLEPGSFTEMQRDMLEIKDPDLRDMTFSFWQDHAEQNKLVAYQTTVAEKRFLDGIKSSIDGVQIASTGLGIVGGVVRGGGLYTTKLVLSEKPHGGPQHWAAIRDFAIKRTAAGEAEVIYTHRALSTITKGGVNVRLYPDVCEVMPSGKLRITQFLYSETPAAAAKKEIHFRRILGPLLESYVQVNVP